MFLQHRISLIERTIRPIADTYNRQAFDVLHNTYPVVAEPGPDVIVLHATITDLKQSKPALNAVTMVIPIGLTISAVKKGAGGSCSGLGTTSTELTILDSVTNDVIGVAQDEKKAGFEGRLTKWGSTQAAFDFWAERMKFLLDRV